MRLGEILDRTFQIYRERFWVFFAMAAIPGAAMTALESVNLFLWKLRPPPDTIRLLGINSGNELFVLGEYHCSLFFHALVWPWMIIAASQAYLGAESGILSSLRECGRRWGSWIGLSLMVYLLALIVPEVSGAAVGIGIAALGVWLSGDSEAVMDPLMTWSMSVLMVAGYAFSLWMGAAYLEAIPAWCVERLKLRKSLGRGRRLSKGGRWRITFTRTIPVIIGVTLQWAAYLAIRWAMLGVARATHHAWFHYANLENSIYLVSVAAISALVGPVFPVALTLFYYDQRIRKEGFDIEWLMESAGMVEAVVAPADAASGGETGA
jgi:hypothetical protein